MDKPEILDFSQERIRVLHFTWIAFFLTFVVWFNMSGIIPILIEEFEGLTKSNIKALLVMNVALTIPARIVVGNLIDKYGPRIIFSGLMVVMVIPGLTFAFADDVTQLLISRLILGSIGAGFVIGIKMTANWFPAKMVGRAEGFYAGWGNFGSAAAAAAVPFFVVHFFTGPDGWRWSLAITSIITAVYGAIYFFLVKDFPAEDSAKHVGGKGGPMQVSSMFDLVQYCLWEFPLFAALGLVGYVLQKQVIHGENLISFPMLIAVWVLLFILYLADIGKIIKENYSRIKAGVPEEDKFHFGSVAALNTTYFANFGAELAIVSMLPMFFYDIFSTLLNDSGERIMSLEMAGLVAGSFAFMNLVARPLGGILSDSMGSRKNTMLLYMGGITVGFFLMALIPQYGEVVMEKGKEVQKLVPMFGGTWWLVVSVIITMTASFFVQGAEGATFAIIPSIKKGMTGRIAGMAGAYGNVGAVTYLFLYTFLDDKTFLFILAGGAFISLISCAVMLKEPKGSFGEDEEVA